MVETPLSDDQIREDILRYFYDKWKKPRGMDSHKIKITKIKNDLNETGLNNKQIIKNLNYMIISNWIDKNTKELKFKTNKMTYPSEEHTYSITEKGINFFEGNSKFQNLGEFPGINISKVSGAVIIGNDNIVQNKYENHYNILDDIVRKIKINQEISDKEKVEYIAEINTIKSQISKSTPNKETIKNSWKCIEKLSRLNGFIGIIEKLKPIMISLISSII